MVVNEYIMCPRGHVIVDCCLGNFILQSYQKMKAVSGSESFRRVLVKKTPGNFLGLRIV